MGGSERLRTFTMDVVTVGFIGGMLVQSFISMMGDRTTWTTTELLRSLRRVKGSPFVRKEVWRRLRDYNRPDFHPDDHDTTELLARWREVLFGSEGTLNERLAQPAPSAA
jgi:predicted metal-dependent hydrolase